MIVTLLVRRILPISIFIWGLAGQGAHLVRAQSTSASYRFVTLAGFNGTSLQLLFPYGLAVDAAGNVFFSDSGNHVIRRLAPDGTVTIFAGQLKLAGNNDGAASVARLNTPNGLVFDRDGNLYVADSGSHLLRKITPGGVVSTVAGNSAVQTDVDGLADSTGFGTLSHLAIDGAGNIYITSFTTIRKFVPSTRTLSTLAGVAGVYGAVDGIGSRARFGTPLGIAIDASGNLLVADSTLLRRVNLTTGEVTTWLGVPNTYETVDGIGAEVRFYFTQGLCVDATGTVYVAQQNGVVRQVTPAGRVTTIAGNPLQYGTADGYLGLSRLYYMQGIALDGGGNLYIADTGNHLIRRLDSTGYLSTVVGAASTGTADGYGSSARFSRPRRPTLDSSGNLYVADEGNLAVRKVSPAGQVSTVATGIWAWGLTIDAAGNMYVADSGYSVIYKITPAGVKSTWAGRSGEQGSADGPSTVARFNQPNDVAIDGSGNVFVADGSNATIRKITPDGVVSTLAGLAGQTGSTDGVGAAARFRFPTALVVDAAGTVVFVADVGNSTIRRISVADGNVTTFAGVTGDARSLDGIGTTARFASLGDLAMDSAGNLFVTETTGAVRRITAQGVVTTIGGSPGSSGSVDGVGAAARFKEPAGIAVSASGTLYITDSGNNTVRVGQSATPTIVVQPVSRTVLAGTPISFTVDAIGNGPIYYQWRKNGALIPGATSPTLILGSASSELAGTYTVSLVNFVGTVQSAAATLALHAPATITAQPQGASVAVGSSPSVRVVVSGGTPAPTIQWQKDGVDLPGATSATLTLNNFKTSDAGAYAAVVTNSAATLVSSAAVLGVASTAKVSGGATEFSANIVHANGNVYDQVLMTGPSATITADPGQVTRVSFLDLNDDLVQVEFSGAGSLTLSLAAASGPMLPVKYNQEISYMKGHAALVIAGANETTNLSVFSVGRATAVNQALFKMVTYDGMADLASISIASANGKFGGIRAGNGSFFARSGTTGIDAPNVEFTGPVYIGYLSALETAIPALRLGAVSDARVTGGDLAQANGRAVQVDGSFRLLFTAGTDSHGAPRPAAPNRARFERNGVDVTADIVVNPSP